VVRGLCGATPGRAGREADCHAEPWRSPSDRGDQDEKTEAVVWQDYSLVNTRQQWQE